MKFVHLTIGFVALLAFGQANGSDVLEMLKILQCQLKYKHLAEYTLEKKYCGIFPNGEQRAYISVFDLYSDLCQIDADEDDNFSKVTWLTPNRCTASDTVNPFNMKSRLKL